MLKCSINLVQARRIEWHERCKHKYRFEHGICNNEQRWNDDKSRCTCKELIDKRVGDKGFVWSPSNCQCECYESCHFSEYLDYKSCKCKKRLVNNLAEHSSAEECTENIVETRLVEITSSKNKNRHKCSSCTLFLALFSILFFQYLC